MLAFDCMKHECDGEQRCSLKRFAKVELICLVDLFELALVPRRFSSMMRRMICATESGGDEPATSSIYQDDIVLAGQLPPMPFQILIRQTSFGAEAM